MDHRFGLPEDDRATRELDSCTSIPSGSSARRGSGDWTFPSYGESFPLTTGEYGLHLAHRRADNTPWDDSHRACAPRRTDDSGFTLVEAVVALFVLGIIFTALATAAMGSIRASYNSRAEQQAIDFATEALEQARRVDYYTLGHDAADLATDTHVTACGVVDCFDAGQGSEELVTLAGASVNPHTRVISSAGEQRGELPGVDLRDQGVHHGC